MTTQIKIRIINKAGNRVTGARVAVFDGDMEIRSFVSADGESSFEPDTKYAAHLLQVRVSKGKSAQEKTCRLEGDTVSLTFELEDEPETPPPPPPPPWKRLLIPAGLVLLGLIVWLVWSLIPSPAGTLGTITPARPRIISFTADPQVIQSGTRSRLAWEVEGADSVNISPDVGRVPPSGQSAVNPSQTTTYTLVAQNPSDEIRAEVTVRVHQLSQAMSISALATPQTVKPGEKTTIVVSVRDSNRRPVSGARVEVRSGGGRFLPAANTRFNPRDRLHEPYSATGLTNRRGEYTTWWVVNPAAPAYVMGVKASKEGFVDSETKLKVEVR